MKPNLTDQSLMDQSLTQGAGAVPAPRATHPLEAPLLETRSVCLRYDGDLVLRDVSMQVAEGEIYAVIGPSGCGKTSLLRVIAGLERAQAGEVWLGGECIDDVPAHRRGIGMMFQELALFPHLDVRANVAFGLRMQGLARGPRDARLDEMLALVGLSGYGDRKVYELSGGERQRVALARSLAPRPRLLLLDEPVGALDRALREQLLSELGQILRAPGLTAIYVTHDQEEAFALADRVMVMDAGRVRQIGRPQALYGAPAGAWVARFLGLTNLVPGEVEPQAPSSSPSPSPAAMGRGAGGEAPAPHAVLVPHPHRRLHRPRARRRRPGHPPPRRRASAGRARRPGHRRAAAQHDPGRRAEPQLPGPAAAPARALRRARTQLRHRRARGASQLVDGRRRPRDAGPGLDPPAPA